MRLAVEFYQQPGIGVCEVGTADEGSGSTPDHVLRPRGGETTIEDHLPELILEHALRHGVPTASGGEKGPDHPNTTSTSLRNSVDEGLDVIQREERTADSGLEGRFDNPFVGRPEINDRSLGGRYRHSLVLNDVLSDEVERFVDAQPRSMHPIPSCSHDLNRPDPPAGEPPQLGGGLVRRRCERRKRGDAGRDSLQQRRWCAGDRIDAGFKPLIPTSSRAMVNGSVRHTELHSFLPGEYSMAESRMPAKLPVTVDFHAPKMNVDTDKNRPSRTCVDHRR